MATVLIAESDLEGLKELRNRLETMGLNLVEASGWPETLQKAALHRPDLVLVSEDLPQLATLQMCLQLRGIGGMFKTPLVLILADQAEDLSPETMRRSRITEAVSRSQLRSKLLEILRRHLPTTGSGLGPERTPDSIELIRGLPVTPDGTVASASGDLAQMFAAALLGELASRWSTGTLALEKEHTDIRIYLQRGNIVDASTNLPALSLPTLLVQNRLVAEADILQAQQQVQVSGGLLTLEHALVAQASIDEQRLRRVLLYQRQHAVLLPFSWREGRFAFEPGPLESERLEPGFNSVEILFAGLRSLRDVHRIEAALPPPPSLLRRTQHAFDGFQVSKLSDVERNVLLLLDDGASVGNILSRPRLDRSEAVRALCALYAGGVVELLAAEAPVLPRERPEPAPEEPQPVRAAAQDGPASSSAPAAGRAAAEEPSPSEPLAIEEGSLSGLPVAKLLAELYADRRTGVLVLQEDEAVVEVSVRKGRIVSARSNRLLDAWPRVLERRGLLTPLAARRMEQDIGPEISFAAALPIQADSVLRHLPLDWMRIEDILLALFSWRRGAYRFEEGPLAESGAATEHTESVLLEGIRRLGGKAWNTTSLPPATHYVAARPEAFSLELGPSEDRLLSALDGRLMVVDTLDLSERLKCDVQPLLHGLILLGLVRTGAKPLLIEPAEIIQRRQAALRRQIEEFLPLAESENYFAILGVSMDVSPEDLKLRYRMLRERFHPERAREIGLPEAMDLLSDIFGKIYLAYQSLSKPDVRQAHLVELERQAASI